MDYLHPLWLRFSVSALTALGLTALGLWAAQILLAVAAA
jgi:succinate dehydrogenase / fumarate reductase membrane anchor subunit